MTRHYTHVGELAAGRAVAAPPWVMGEAASAPDGGAKDVAALARKMRGIWEAVTVKSWKEKKAEGLALMSRVETALSEVGGSGWVSGVRAAVATRNGLATPTSTVMRRGSGG
jgi:hypothetical protein